MNATSLQSLDDSLLVMPPRSRLFNLKPTGLGTPIVECLASYIHRLAAAHGLPTWVLVGRELVPQFKRKSITGPNGYCDLLGQVGMTINGDNHTARESVAILQSLTGQTTLSSLTFCRPGNLVAEQRVLRRTQAWCPECLNQWRQDEQPIYQPLIWLISQLKTCPIHGCSLQDRCPDCGKIHTPLTRYRWNGKCPRCSAWLGKTSISDGHVDNQSQADWKKYSAGALDRFVGAMQSLPNELPRTFFHANIKHLVEKHFGGNHSALARTLNVQGYTARCWAYGTQRPSLASLLALSYCFGGEMLDWLVGHMNFLAPHDFRIIKPAVAERIRRPLRRQSREGMRAYLALAVQTAESPPPSFRVVCKRIELDPTTANRAFHELAVAIKARHQDFRADAKRARALSRHTTVEAAVKHLLSDGMTLSFKHMRSVLPSGISTRDKLVRDEFRRQQELLTAQA